MRLMGESSSRQPRGPLRLAVWADDGARSLLQQIAGHEGVELVMVGGTRPTDVRSLADAVAAKVVGDPREALASDAVDALLLLAPETLEVATLRAMLELDKPLLSERPIPVRIEDWVDFESVPRRPVPVPRISASRHWLAGGDWIEAIGPVEAMHVDLRCHPEEGSLAGRLADGLDLVLSRFGMPAQIAAFGMTLADPPEFQHRRPQPPVTMTAAFTDGRWATISVAIGPYPWHRGVELLGPDGAVRWNDRSIEWIGADGTERGSGTGLPGGAGLDAPATRPGAVFGEFLHRWWLRQSGPADPPMPHRELLACLEATRLASRTGSLEDPGGLLSLL